MAANAATADVLMRTLTDRQNDITTIDSHPTAASLTLTEVVNTKPGILELTVHSGRTKRGMEFPIQGRPPEWLILTIKRCAPLLLLPFDWDHESAPPIDRLAIRNAVETLGTFMDDRSSAPQWVPSPNGGVQLVWHEKGIDLEIEFEPDAPEGYAVFADHQDGVEWDGPIGAEHKQLRALFAQRLIRE
jgi:hypothetical protein